MGVVEQHPGHRHADRRFRAGFRLARIEDYLIERLGRADPAERAFEERAVRNGMEDAKMAKKKTEPETGSWVVVLKVTRTVRIVVDDCTEEQARSDPYQFHDDCDEDVLEQTDWDVISVEPE
jgi:hypothetical protein